MEELAPRLSRGRVVHIATVEAKVPEGRIARGLQNIQAHHKNVALGSYPFYREDGAGVQLVARGRDASEVEVAAKEIESLIESEGVDPIRIQSESLPEQGVH
jgi:molybdopterin-biosynthesis enzyme MoeA-like protein